MRSRRISHIGEPNRPWCTGWARYRVEHQTPTHLLVVAVTCRIEGVAINESALLDTGAQWSVIGGDLAELARPHAEDMGYLRRMDTRLGLVEGRAHRLSIILVADEGDDLAISATVLLAPDWSGPIVLGYRGLLERIRLGFDPGVHDDEHWFCFGETG